MAKPIDSQMEELSIEEEECDDPLLRAHIPNKSPVENGTNMHVNIDVEKLLNELEIEK